MNIDYRNCHTRMGGILAINATIVLSQLIIRIVYDSGQRAGER